MTPFFFWIIVGIIFLVAEMFTVSFFALCLAVGAFFAAGIQFLFPSGEWILYFTSPSFVRDILAFSLVSGIFMIFLPQMLRKTKNCSTVFESALGKEIEIQEKGGEKVISINHQLWRIENEKEFSVGKKGVLVSFIGTRAVLRRVEE